MQSGWTRRAHKQSDVRWLCWRLPTHSNCVKRQTFLDRQAHDLECCRWDWKLPGGRRHCSTWKSSWRLRIVLHLNSDQKLRVIYYVRNLHMSLAEMKLYHCKNSRSLRPLWALEEMGLDYDLVTMAFPPRFEYAGYLDINPLGTVPSLFYCQLPLTASKPICHYFVDI